MQSARSHHYHRDRMRHGAASVTWCFGRNSVLMKCSRKGSLPLGSDPAKNSCSAQIGRFGVLAENCSRSVRFNSVHARTFGNRDDGMELPSGYRADDTTKLRTETRVLCADVATRRQFCSYWMRIRPFSGLIRQEMLAAVRNTAESGHSWSADLK